MSNAISLFLSIILFDERMSNDEADFSMHGSSRVDEFCYRLFSGKFVAVLLQLQNFIMSIWYLLCFVNVNEVQQQQKTHAHQKCGRILSSSNRSTTRVRASIASEQFATDENEY